MCVEFFVQKWPVRRHVRPAHVVQQLKVKVGFLYSAAYTMTGPARFTILEVTVDW